MTSYILLQQYYQAINILTPIYRLDHIYITAKYLLHTTKHPVMACYHNRVYLLLY